MGLLDVLWVAAAAYTLLGIPFYAMIKKRELPIAYYCMIGLLVFCGWQMWFAPLMRQDEARARDTARAQEQLERLERMVEQQRLEEARHGD